MKKFILIALLFLSLSCESQIFLNPYAFQTTDVWLVIGDSKTAYSTNTDNASPSPTTGTAFQWDALATSGTKYSIQPLTSTDLVNAGSAGSNQGSPWPQFAIDYNTLTGHKVIIVDGHSYGSSFYTTSGVLSWYTNGTLYDTAVNRAGDALRAANLTKLKGIIVVLGINDATGAETTGNIGTAITSLFTRLTTDFPGIPIYVDQMGVANASPTSRYGFIRNAIRDLHSTFADVWEGPNEVSLYSWGLYGADVLHFTQAANNKLGSQWASFVTSTETDPDVRRVLCYFYDAISSTKQAGIKTFILDEKTSGNWQKYDVFQVYIADTENNAYIDWAGRTSPLKGSTPATFSANNYISTDGSASYLRVYYHPSALKKYASQDDIFVGIGTGTMTTTAGTAATAFGGASSTTFYLAQDATSGGRTIFTANNGGSNTYTTDTKLQSNTDYLIRRTSSSSYELLKAGSVVSTKSVSSTGENGIFWDVGCRNNSNPDTPLTGSYYNGQFLYLISGQQSGFNVSDFLTHWGTLKTVLQTP